MKNNVFEINWKMKENPNITIVKGDNCTESDFINFHYNDEEKVEMKINNKAIPENIPVIMTMDTFEKVFDELIDIRNALYKSHKDKQSISKKFKDLVYDPIVNSQYPLIFHIWFNDEFRFRILNMSDPVHKIMDIKIDIENCMGEYIKENIDDLWAVDNISQHVAESIAFSILKTINVKDDAYKFSSYIYRHLVIENSVINTINEIILKRK